QRTVRAEQPEEPHLQLRLRLRRASLVAELKQRQRRRRETELGFLSEPQRFVRRTTSVPPSRLGVEDTLDAPQRLIEVVAVRRLRQCRKQRQSVGLAPHCGTHR